MPDEAKANSWFLYLRQPQPLGGGINTNCYSLSGAGKAISFFNPIKLLWFSGFIYAEKPL